MRQGGANSFFRFTLGFTLFIALSFGITYAVTTISIAQEKERQVGAAFQVMVGKTAQTAWWKIW
ncbi:MAG: hypothetical protein AAB734_01620 [Patescibacteria group bacterium]